MSFLASYFYLSGKILMLTPRDKYVDSSGGGYLRKRRECVFKSFPSGSLQAKAAAKLLCHS